MGIETLNNAAFAAGFAMAAPEEAYEDLQPLPASVVAGAVRSSTRQSELQWQPSRGVLVHERAPAPTRSDWLGLLLGALGRRPPPRRPALTAEA